VTSGLAIVRSVQSVIHSPYLLTSSLCTCIERVVTCGDGSCRPPTRHLSPSYWPVCSLRRACPAVPPWPLPRRCWWTRHSCRCQS
jgi:hypothetical protein